MSTTSTLSTGTAVQIETKPTTSADQIRAQIQGVLKDVTTLRRDLHAHPELAFEEHRTSKVIQAELTRLNIPFKAGLARGTGVVAHLAPTTNPTSGAAKDLPAVALRADIDALPIQEQTKTPYASCTTGIMHACGHDGHTAMLLGAARVLSQLSHRPQPVTFVFQPAEEHGGGGQVLCQEGIMKGSAGGGIGPAIGRIYGQHGWPSVPLHTVASRKGPMLANTDDFYVTVRGVQAHGAYPHQGRDPILAGAQIVTALQSIASRSVGPLDSVVCTVGQFHAGTATNIIPETAQLVGTVRTLSMETKAIVKQRFFEIVEGTAAAFGCKAEIDWQDGYPVTFNDFGLTDTFFDIARSTLGTARVQELAEPTMGGEDFSFYGQHVPACFFMLGLKPAGAGQMPSLHQPDFDFNDEALATGIEMFVNLALRG